MIQQISINIEIKVERVVDFLLLNRRWFDTPALKLLLSLVPDIESLWGWSPFELTLLIVIALTVLLTHMYYRLPASSFLFSRYL